MCLGAAWEAEAPPTHLEALNSLKGPWSAEAKRERPPLSFLCGKASSGPRWAFIWLGWLFLQWGYLRKVGGGEASLPAILPLPLLYPTLPLPSQATRFPQAFPFLGKSILVPPALASQAKPLSPSVVSRQAPTERLLRVTLCGHHKRETEDLGIPLTTATGPKCGQ